MRLYSLSALLLLSCNVALVPPQNQGQPDAGPNGQDAGVDAGQNLDAGQSVDAGNTADAGVRQDAGQSSDAGQPQSCIPVLPPINCEPDWYGDGECDPRNNFGECTFDGGDCCEASCTNGDCGTYAFDCRDPQLGGSTEVLAIGEPCTAGQAPFDVVKMRQELTLLASDALEGRGPGHRGDAITRRYLEERFRCLGLSATLDGCYQQHFAAGNDLDPTANVVGVLPGTDRTQNEIIVVGAHHDHLGKDGVIYNGANDNVSGVVGLIALAEALVENPPQRTVVFAVFGGEEEGLLGSVHFVNHFDTSDIVYMINLDMIGNYDSFGSVDAFGSFDGTKARLALDEVLLQHTDLVVHKNLPSPPEDSDFDAFCSLNIPYLYFETFDNSCYHEACDDAERIDYPHLAELSEILFEVTRTLANTPESLAGIGCQR